MDKIWDFQGWINEGAVKQKLFDIVQNAIDDLSWIDGDPKKAFGEAEDKEKFVDSFFDQYIAKLEDEDEQEFIKANRDVIVEILATEIAEQF